MTDDEVMLRATVLALIDKGAQSGAIEVREFARSIRDTMVRFDPHWVAFTAMMRAKGIDGESKHGEVSGG